eukprot:521653-Pyramimonas_sp.AAC.1
MFRWVWVVFFAASRPHLLTSRFPLPDRVRSSARRRIRPRAFDFVSVAPATHAPRSGRHAQHMHDTPMRHASACTRTHARTPAHTHTHTHTGTDYSSARLACSLHPTPTTHAPHTGQPHDIHVQILRGRYARLSTRASQA